MRPSPTQTLRLSLILLAMPLALAACNRRGGTGSE
jgi:predicted small secreted protein